jgi:hypothetical protein
MVYGYALMKREKETYGLPCYCSDEWGDNFKITKVRLFSTKEERDNAMKIEKKNYGYEEGTNMLPFETKSKQGKLTLC